jgi:spore germination protein YaaH
MKRALIGCLKNIIRLRAGYARSLEARHPCRFGWHPAVHSLPSTPSPQPDNIFKAGFCIFSFYSLTFFFFIFSSSAFALENTFYILHQRSAVNAKINNPGFSSLSAHYSGINILISQAYRIRKDGTVLGFINPEVLDFTDKHHLKLMALVTNASFDKDIAHLFLSNKQAQKEALDSILLLCHKHHLYGVQFDFEGISIKDKKALTLFFKQAYEDLHREGFIVSFAVVPATSDKTPASDFLKRQYENWSGAYDLAALAEHSDFITLMAYDQHTKGTTPGPSANQSWLEATVKYALRYLPPEKISLGIPTYSNYWYIRNRSAGKITVNLDAISHQQALQLLNKFHAHPQWDEINKVNYAIYQRDWLNEYLFIENARSFHAKRELAKQYHLRGVSVFSLGNEDPEIWSGVL